MAWSNIGGSGENVKPEVDIQTPLIEDIKEILVGKATGANATADTILEGYSAYVGQELVVGKYKPHGLYVWKKYEYESSTVGDFVDYVVSDTETAYPDGGMQGGYWYEKVVDGIPLSVFESSKYAIDTFTLTSDTQAMDYSISHSLGSTPKFVFLKIDNMPTGSGAINVILNFVCTTYLTLSNMSAWGLASEFYLRDSSYSYEDKDVFLSNAEVTFNGAGWYRAGHTYTLITAG